MIYKFSLCSIKGLLIQLLQDKVIAYPTESVFGLGCNPDSKKAVQNLLRIKSRSWKKGLILIAANYFQLSKYIDYSYLNAAQRSRVFSGYPVPITWVFPARSSTPYWITGQFASVAVRISQFEPVKNLCLSFGNPLISTSANISGYPPARTVTEVYDQLGRNFPIMHESVLGFPNPSKIKDAITGKIIRK